MQVKFTYIFSLVEVKPLLNSLSHSTSSTASLGQRDLIPWSAHETAPTWVCNFRDLTRHNLDCDVTVIYR